MCAVVQLLLLTLCVCRSVCMPMCNCYSCHLVSIYHCQSVCAVISCDVLVPGVFVLDCVCWLAVWWCELATAAIVCIHCATACCPCVCEVCVRCVCRVCAVVLLLLPTCVYAAANVCVAMLLPMCVCRTPEDLLLLQPCVNLLCYCCCQHVYTDAAAWVCVPCVCGCIILASAAILCLLFTVIQLLPMCVCRVLCRVCAVVYLLLLQPCVNPLCYCCCQRVY